MGSMTESLGDAGKECASDTAYIIAEAKQAWLKAKVELELAGGIESAHRLKYYEVLVQELKGKQIVISGAITHEEKEPRYRGEQPAGKAYRPVVDWVDNLIVRVEDAAVLEHPDTKYQALPWVWCRSADGRGVAGVLATDNESYRLQWSFYSPEPQSD